MDSDTTTSPVAPPSRLTSSTPATMTPPPIGLSAASVPISLSSVGSGAAPGGEGRLSYKFQRLREKLRAAIASGELSGKLPGERQLARRFRVNAKTLSKALTDLAAEGLLERSIGRGTFVKGSTDAGSAGAASSATATDRWLIICDAQHADAPLVQQLAQASGGNVQIVHETASLRPSFLSSFKAVIDVNPQTPASFLRDLVVRNVAVVLVGREPATYSMNAVLIDRMLAASQLARELMLAGHRRFVAVERRGSTLVAEAIRRTAQRIAPDATVDIVFAAETVGAIEQGATAAICDSAIAGRQVRDALQKAGIAIPGRASVAAIGSTTGRDQPCSGYFVPIEQKTEAILKVLRDGAARRPTTLWLAGAYHDGGTMGPTDAMRGAAGDDITTFAART
jgi:DNA-binding transcriptional regulator YhcF (GntR family)